VTGLCDGGAVGRGVVDLRGVADDGGALEDDGALEDARVLEDGGAVEDGETLETGGAVEESGVLEDGGVVSGGGALMLVLAIGAACGWRLTPDSLPAVLQPVITIMTPAIQASSGRIRITDLVNPASAIHRRGRKGRSATFHRNPRTYVFA
jgi:hypothetical protein